MAIARARQLLWTSLGVFLATVLICVLREPNDVFSHNGLSFYGNFAATAIPYGIGLAATAYLMLRAANAMNGHAQFSSLRHGLNFMAVSLLGIVATPSFSSFSLIQDLHDAFGFIIFLTQVILAADYLIKIRRIWIDWALVAAQWFAALVIFISLPTIAVLNLTLIGQVLAVTIFTMLAVRTLNRTGNGDL